MQRISRTIYVERLKEAVSGSFAFVEGETFEEWVERAQTLNLSQRATLAARMGSTQRKLLGEYLARKRGVGGGAEPLIMASTSGNVPEASISGRPIGLFEQGMTGR
jgi:hypothetical protein